VVLAGTAQAEPVYRTVTEDLGTCHLAQHPPLALTLLTKWTSTVLVLSEEMRCNERSTAFSGACQTIGIQHH
jgi:hypothetical protein